MNAALSASAYPVHPTRRGELRIHSHVHAYPEVYFELTCALKASSRSCTGPNDLILCTICPEVYMHVTSQMLNRKYSALRCGDFNLRNIQMFMPFHPWRLFAIAALENT